MKTLLRWTAFFILGVVPIAFFLVTMAVKNGLSKNRFLNKIYAKTHHYFWIKCPLCQNYFGGHESGENYIMTSWFTGRVVCSNDECQNAAKKQMLQFMKDNPPPVGYVREK